jgi:hypothetical protein
LYEGKAWAAGNAIISTLRFHRFGFSASNPEVSCRSNLHSFIPCKWPQGPFSRRPEDAKFEYMIDKPIQMIYRLKKNWLIFVFIFLIHSNKIACQTIRRIYLEEYKYTLVSQGKCIDTFSAKISRDRTITIHLLSCKGQMNIECYNKNLILMEMGSYINSLDLLKKYVDLVTFDQRYPNNHKVTIGIYSYYQPLRDGTWRFYNDEKKLYMQKNYKKGVLIDSIMVK